MTSTASKKYFSLSTFTFGLAGILISFLILFWTVDAQTSSGLSGYAWSSNIGWINFNPTGPYPENPQTGVRFNPTNKSITGWARALSYGGGWDGWIKMSGTASNGNLYGVTANPTGLLSGYAWGDDVVGWVDFSRVTCNGCTTTVPPQSFNLTVTKTGTGTGSVTTSPTGTNCAGGVASCNTYPSGTSVTLAASPTVGSTFAGWGGEDCSGTGSCVVVMDDDKDVIARFDDSIDPPDSRTLSVNIVGQGEVSLSGNICGPSDANPDCSYSFDEGSFVSLMVEPAEEGWTFTGWTGDCDTLDSVCSVRMNENRTVTATFTQGGGGGGDDFELGCSGDLVAGSCVIIVQCDDQGVDCDNDTVYSEDYITITPSNSENPIDYIFDSINRIKQGVQLVICPTPSIAQGGCESLDSNSLTMTGPFYIFARENSDIRLIGQQTVRIYIKVGGIEKSFILKFVPRSTQG